MFSLLTLLSGCKDRSTKIWEACPQELVVHQDTEETEFGFRLLSTKETVYITAPSDCSAPLYELTNGDVISATWNHNECARWGQEIVLKDGSPLLFGPLNEQRWQNVTGTDTIGSTNIRRFDTLPDGQLVQLFSEWIKIGGVEHPLPATAMDMARYDDNIAVVMRGTPTQIWTLEETFLFEEDSRIYSRIHPFFQALSGKQQWVLGGSSDLVYTDGSSLTVVPLPDFSILKQDMRHNPNISMGYASTLMDIDDDGKLDWFVGAPTAGSGQRNDFPEQSGWVGWFEMNNRKWVLQKEWVGSEPFAHFGWSLAIQISETERSLLVGAPGNSTVSQAVCLQSMGK